MKNKLNKEQFKTVHEAMNGIFYMVKRYCTEEDVQQTVNLTFLQCVTRYEKKESERGPIPFSAFLYSYFLYLLKKNVDMFLIDQIGRKSFPLVTQNEMGPEDSTSEGGGSGVFVETMEYASYSSYFATDVDEYWVLGLDVNPPFSYLTIQERQLLKWRYIDGKRSSEIASKITEHPNTVREHLSKIREKIKNHLAEDGIDEGFVLELLKEQKDD